YCDL
ncbi:hypothetical protein CPC197_0358B, partial [Chlamydia psittaci C1/97]